MRIFKIARITHHTYTGGVFRPGRKHNTYTFDLEPRPQQTDLVMTVTPEGRYEAEDWLGVENVKPAEDGVNFLAAGSVPVSEETFAKIVKFGKNAKVVSPASVRDAVKKMCLSCLEVNG